MTDAFDTNRRECENALRSISVAISRVKSGDRRASDEGALALARARKALQTMHGHGDSWVVGKLNAETGRLASELERATLVLSGSNPSSRPGQVSAMSSSAEEDARARIQRSNEVLNESNGYVRDTARLMGESRNVGVNTLQAMSEHHEELLTARGDVRDAEDAMQTSRQILTRMAKQALVNKVFLWLIILLLIVVNVCFLYFGFIKN